jgi:ribose-phosphate pyrophosphokinase
VVRDSLKCENGKPCVPILASAPTTPNRLPLSAGHLDDALDKHDTRLRIFSGTANPALSQVELLVFEA